MKQFNPLPLPCHFTDEETEAWTVSIMCPRTYDQKDQWLQIQTMPLFKQPLREGLGRAGLLVRVLSCSCTCLYGLYEVALGPGVNAGGCLSWQRLKSQRRAVTQASSSDPSVFCCAQLLGVSLCSKHLQLSNWGLCLVVGGSHAPKQKKKKTLGIRLKLKGETSCFELGLHLVDPQHHRKTKDLFPQK